MSGAISKAVCIKAKAIRGLGAGFSPRTPALLMDQGRIKALGHEAFNDPQAVIWDLSRFHLTPAPLDSHVHLWLGGPPLASLRSSYLAGIAAVRDLGNTAAKERPKANEAPPLVVSSGTGLGQGWLAQAYDRPGEYVRAVRQRAGQGVDLIKVFATGLLDFEEPGKVQEPLAVSPDALEAICREADKAGLGVAVHASGEAACGAAIKAGAASIEHGYFMSHRQLEALAKSKTHWAPTLAAVLAHADDLQCRHLGVVRENIRKIAEMQMEAMRKAEALGVKLVMGTDAGSYGLPHGKAVFLEMRAWLDAGLSPKTVYDAATCRAAGLMGLEGELGSIQPGARAWLMATREDPAQNPMTMQSPVWRSY